MISPTTGRVSSEYSLNRRHPVSGRLQTHAGIDIAAPTGTAVVAAFSGVVEGVRTASYPGDPILWSGAKSGNHIRIRNDDEARQYYGHLSKVFVRPGERVREGQIIGEVGATGVVTGPHLHFETWSNGSINSHFDPRILFRRYGVTPGEARFIPTSTAEEVLAMASKEEVKAALVEVLTGANIVPVARGGGIKHITVVQALRNQDDHQNEMAGDHK